MLLSCQTESGGLDQILSNGSDFFRQTLENQQHEVQIIYGEIIEDSIIHHYYNRDSEKYFYPASTIKMPVAFAAMKKAQELRISMDDPMIIDSTAIYPRQLSWDSTLNAPITIRNQIQKIFTVSDNSASNILYGWLGKDYINELYGTVGIETRIIHQLGENAFSFKPISNHYSRKVQINNDSEYLQFPETKQHFHSELQVQDQQKGAGYIDSLENTVNEPFDFSKKNFIPLENLLFILEAGVRPDLTTQADPFTFEPSYQEAIMYAMQLLPKNLPPYDTLDDNYVKFLGFGTEDSGKLPNQITILNKVGWAYGYLLDVAYFEDTKNGLVFFLAAVIHVNKNQIYNDGIYEYEEVGLPFLDELGDLVYEYELSKQAQ